MSLTESRRSARIVLFLGILSGIGNLLVTPLASPEQAMLASDVYLAAAEAYIDGENLYDVHPPGRQGYTYLYPPITILFFLPYAVIGSDVVAFVGQTLVNLGFGFALALVIWRALARRGVTITSVDRALLVTFCLVSAHSAITLLNGQVTIPLGFALAVGFDALDRRRDRLAGIAFALAALVKVFPAVIGIWLLRQRAWSGVVAAIATGLGGLLLGAVLLGPDLTVTYLEDVLLARYEEETFVGRPDPTQSTDGAQRQLAALGVSTPWLSILSFAIPGALLALLYRTIDTPVQRLAAMLGTVTAMLLAFPLQPLYFPLVAYPLVLALYLFPPGRARQLLIIGTLLTYVRLSFELFQLSLEWLPLPAIVSDGMLALAEPMFVFILPPTAGLWLLLGACLVIALQ